MPKTKKTEKLSITLPKDLAAQLRERAPRGGLSALLTDAAEFYLAWERQKLALEESFGAWKDEDHPDLKTPEDTTNYVRALREADDARLARLAQLRERGGK